MKRRWYVASIGAVIIMSAVVSADSIWDRRDPRAAHLFQDNRARNLGDVLTVAINESTNANEREQRALDRGKNATTGMTFAGKSKSGSIGGSASVDFTLGSDSKRGFNGSAQLTSDRTFLDRITVVVVDVLPNGNLVVEGTRTRVVGGEQRELRITGIVRPADIGQQNTVESRFVANFKIYYSGKGQQSSYTSQSWFNRVMSRLWPF